VRPEDKDKILQIARPFIPPEKLDEFVRKLDELEEEKEPSVFELVDRIAELIARLTVDELFSVRDPELRRLSLTVVKTTTKYLIGPKLAELLIRQTISVVER